MFKLDLIKPLIPNIYSRENIEVRGKICVSPK